MLDINVMFEMRKLSKEQSLDVKYFVQKFIKFFSGSTIETYGTTWIHLRYGDLSR
jgi:preprotein translocase subunit SecE